jgi:hypothetical protein
LTKPVSEVAVVRQAVRERRTVVEHVFVRAVFAGWTAIDGALEQLLFLPVPKDALLDLREVRLRRDFGVGLGGRRHRLVPATVRNRAG